MTLLDESENRVEKPLVDRGTICKKVKEKMKQAETKVISLHNYIYTVRINLNTIITIYLHVVVHARI